MRDPTLGLDRVVRLAVLRNGGNHSTLRRKALAIGHGRLLVAGHGQGGKSEKADKRLHGNS